MTGIGLWSPRTLISRPRPALRTDQTSSCRAGSSTTHGVGGGANAAGDEVRLQAVGLLRQLGVALAVELDHEHGGGIAFDHRDLARRSRAASASD